MLALYMCVQLRIPIPLMIIRYEIGCSVKSPLSFPPESIKAFVDGKQHKIMTVDEMVTAIKDNYTAGAAAIKKQEDDRNRHAVDTSKKAPK
jgi:predicted small lipoprotein YifL